MTVEMVAPAWMHEQVSAEQYATWTAEQCAGIEIVDGMVLVSPSAAKRHHRLARLLANALDGAVGPDWNADTDFDVRLQDVPLNNRRPDVTVYRAETIDVTQVQEHEAHRHRLPVAHCPLRTAIEVDPLDEPAVAPNYARPVA